MILTRILGGSTALFALLAGLFYGLWTLERAHHRNTKAEYAAFKTEIIDKTALAVANERAQRAAEEKKHADDARQADAGYDALMARYQRMLRQARSGGGTAAAPGEDRDTGVPEGEAEGAIVPFGSILVSTDDALTCAANTAYALSAYDWALTLN